MFKFDNLLDVRSRVVRELVLERHGKEYRLSISRQAVGDTGAREN